MSMTPAQCRAGRAWLQWSQADLAAVASVSVPTIARFETGVTAMSHLGLQAIEAAFTRAGLQPKHWTTQPPIVDLSADALADTIDRTRYEPAGWQRYKAGDDVAETHARVAAIGPDGGGRITWSEFLRDGDRFCYLPPMEEKP